MRSVHRLAGNKLIRFNPGTAALPLISSSSSSSSSWHPSSSTTSTHLQRPYSSLPPFQIGDLLRSAGLAWPSQKAQSPLIKSRDEWLDSLKKQNVRLVWESYQSLEGIILENKRRQRQPSSPSNIAELIKPDDLLRTMEVLSFSPRTIHQNALLHIYSCLNSTYDITPDARHHQCIVRSQLQSNMPDKAIAWIRAHISSDPSFMELTLWDSVIESPLPTIDSKKAIIQEIVNSGNQPTPSSLAHYINTTLHSITIKPGNDSHFSVQDACDIDGVHDRILNSPEVWLVISRKLREQSLLVDAKRYSNKALALARSTGVPDARDDTLWTIVLENHSRDREEQTRFMRNLMKDGFQPTSSTIASLIRSLGQEANVDDIYRLEKSLGITAKEDAWTAVIDVAIAMKNPQSAADTYQHATRSLKPSMELAEKLLTYLLQLKSHKFRQEDKIKIFLAVIESGVGRHSQTPFLPSISISNHPRSKFIYSQVLESIVDRSINAKKIQTIESEAGRPIYQSNTLVLQQAALILTNMQDHGLDLDKDVKEKIAPLFVKHQRDFSAGAKIIKLIRNLGPDTVSAHCWREMLHSFVYINVSPFSAISIPPYNTYFQLLDLMANSGHSTDSEHYLLLFRRYRNQTAPSYPGSKKSSMQSQIYHNLQKAHALLRLDATITPNTALLNTIMDGYNRIGLADASLSIFQEQLLPSDSYDATSLSVILDGLGHSKNKDEGFKIWNMAKERQRREKGKPNAFKITPKLWETWFEFASRTDALEEARFSLFFELGSPTYLKNARKHPIEGDIKAAPVGLGLYDPDRVWATLNMVLLLLGAHHLHKDSDKYVKKEVLLGLIRSYLPEVYNQLAKAYSGGDPAVRRYFEGQQPPWRKDHVEKRKTWAPPGG